MQENALEEESKIQVWRNLLFKISAVDIEK
jgi:hypothetical protein